MELNLSSDVEEEQAAAAAKIKKDSSYYLNTQEEDTVRVHVTLIPEDDWDNYYQELQDHNWVM